MFYSISDIKKELETSGKVTLKTRVNAGSSAQGLDFFEEFIKIKVCERAIEGRANKAIINLLSKELKVAKCKIKILTGTSSPYKLIQIEL